MTFISLGGGAVRWRPFDQDVRVISTTEWTDAAIVDVNSDGRNELAASTADSPVVFFSHDLRERRVIRPQLSPLDSYHEDAPSVGAFGDILDAPGLEFVVGDRGQTNLFDANGRNLARAEIVPQPHATPVLAEEKGAQYVYLGLSHSYGYPSNGSVGKFRLQPIEDPLARMLSNMTHRFVQLWLTPVADGRILGTPAVLDLNGDGKNEVAVELQYSNQGSRGAPESEYGPALAVLDSDGKIVAVADRRGSSDALAVGDTNGNGRPELIASFYQYQEDFVLTPWLPTPGGQLRVYEMSGRKLELLRSIVLPAAAHSPALCDLDGDGRDEIVVSSFANGPVQHGEERAWGKDSLAGNGWLQVFRGDGQRLWEHRFYYGKPGPPTVADLDGDGNYEILHNTNAGVGYVWESGIEENSYEREWSYLRGTGQLPEETLDLIRQIHASNSSQSNDPTPNAGGAPISEWLPLLAYFLAMLGHGARLKNKSR